MSLFQAVGAQEADVAIVGGDRYRVGTKFEREFQFVTQNLDFQHTQVDLVNNMRSS